MTSCQNELNLDAKVACLSTQNLWCRPISKVFKLKKKVNNEIKLGKLIFLG